MGRPWSSHTIKWLLISTIRLQLVIRHRHRLHHNNNNNTLLRDYQ